MRTLSIHSDPRSAAGLRLSALPAATFAAIVIAISSSLAAETFPERLERCGTCHGDAGISAKEKVPSLAGQPQAYLITQLVLFREGIRRSEQMTPQADGLSDGEITALAEHYAALSIRVQTADMNTPYTQNHGGRLNVERRCGTCHLADFSGREQVPRLAGQRIDYLEHAMRAYRDDERAGADTIMTDVLRGLSDRDISVLARFVSRSGTPPS